MSATPDSPQPAPQNPTERDAKGRRLWRAGTLTYTTAGLVILFAWLLWGDFAWNMKDRAIMPMGQLMMRQFEASNLIIGLLTTSVPAAIGLILAPIISVKSDNHRGRWGRRIPYMLIPTPIVTLALFGLAFTVPIADSIHAYLGESSPGAQECRLIVFGLFWTLFEIFQTVAQAVFGGLINDVVPQAVIGRFFGLFRIVSLLAAIVFNFWLIDHAETHSMQIFIGLGLLFGIGFALMCLCVKEGEYPPPAPATETKVSLASLLSPIKAYVVECFTHPYYLWVFLALMLAGLSGGPVNTFSLLYAKSLGMSNDTYGNLLVITYTCSIVLAYPLGWLADKIHPLRLGIIAMALYGVGMLIGGLLATTTTLFAIIFVAHGVIQGVYNTGTASIGQRLFPRAKFAQFASAGGILAALGFMVVPPLIGEYLDNTGQVYRHTFLFSGALGLIALGGYLVVWRYFKRLGGTAAYRAPE